MTGMESFGSLMLKADLDALLQVSDVHPLRLQELCHDVPKEQSPEGGVSCWDVEVGTRRWDSDSDPVSRQLTLSCELSVSSRR